MNICEICKEPIVTHQYARIQEASPVIISGKPIGFEVKGRPYLFCVNKTHTNVDIMRTLPSALYWDVRHRPQGEKLQKLLMKERSNVAGKIQIWHKEFVQIREIQPARTHNG